MKRYKITTRETVWRTYEISVPDDCKDALQFFYDMDTEDQDAANIGHPYHGEWEGVEIEEIKP